MSELTRELACAVLERRAKETPDKDFLRFTGARASYAAFHALSCGYAARLDGLGIGRGEIVPTFFPNALPAAGIWFALMRLGAVWTPINTEFRGEQLISALKRTRASLLITEARFLETILAVLPQLTHVKRIVVHGASAPAAHGGVEFIRFEDLPEGMPSAPVDVDRAATAMIQFTSGSTGVSKAVELSHGYLVGQARLATKHFDLQPSDVVYCPFPLYHWDATIGTVMGALVVGATAALGERFSVSRFWDDVRAFDATMFDFMGATLSFLYERPPSLRDREHKVRLAWGLPMPDFRKAFEARFSISLLEGYGSTEGGVCVFQERGVAYPKGSCGKLCPEFALRLLDEEGREVPTGSVGEIVTRPHDPTLMMNGYLNMPDVNAELIRDGWYYTGDLGRFDEEGHLYFAGRKKDIIRRRGENISALEVEREVESHPAVVEVAAFGVPSPFTEEDVAVAVVKRAGAKLSEEELRAYCEGRMARYMTPEHIFFVEELPKTATAKVAKAELKRMFAPRVLAPAAE